MPPLLYDPGYRAFWLALFASQFGRWLQNTAFGWLVLAATGSPERLGFVLMLRFLPAFVFTLPGGALADRLPRARLLLLLEAAMAALSAGLALALAAGQVGFGGLVAYALVYGSVAALEVPARQAYNVELAGSPRAGQAVALASLSFNISRMLAPAIAGVLIASFGAASPFFLQALFFVPLILVLARSPVAAGGSGRVGRKPLSRGFAYVRRTPLVASTLLLVASVATFGINFQTLVPSYARLVLGLDARGYGLLMSALGVGAMAGAVLNLLSPRVHPRWMLYGAGGLALAEVLMAFLRSVPAASFLLGVAGLSMVLTLVSANATVQTLTPDSLRGRVAAIYALVLMGSGPPGMYLTGLAFALLGAWAPAALGLAVAGVALLLWRRPWPRVLTPV